MLVCDEPLDPDGSRTLNSVLGRQGIALGSQSAGREEGREGLPPPPLGWGFAKLSAVLGWRELRMEPSAWSPKRGEAGRGGPIPHEGRGDGEGGEPWVSKNGAAPPALILADLEASPSGHLKYLPHPILGLGRALKVAKGTDAIRHVPAFLRSNGLLGRHERSKEAGGKVHLSLSHP